ncbi:MAG: NAD(+)/NADH kinase [Planctomycetes bacterium]|nr:NAD(+)/NADH kinase [Planctomycetota bacterium]
MRQALIIVNAKAGRGRALAAADLAAEHLRARGVSVECVPTDHPGHAAELARVLGQDSDLVVVVGGDGTLREAASGLAGRGSARVLGFIPIGHGNVVARELGIPLDPRAAVEVLFSGKPRAMDAGRANGHLFLAMVGVGFDALVTRRVGALRRVPLGERAYQRLGSSVYAACGFLALWRLLPRRFTLSVDGRALDRRPCSIIVANTEAYARDWAVTPGASTSDGVFDYQACWRSAAPLVAWQLLQARRRRRVAPFIAEYGRGKEFVIASSAPFSWQADGDPMGFTERLEIEVLPAHLTILAP